jgi:hypothetical protein
MKNTWRFIAALLVLGVFALAQTSNPFPEQDKFGKLLVPRDSRQISYSPTDLAHNAAVLPVSAATGNTNIIRIGQAKEINYLINCTQAVKVTMQVYVADDVQNAQTAGYSLYGSYDLVTALPSGPQMVEVATELAPNATAGTLTTAIVRLPIAAISFSETNAGATPGTCTGRLLVGYN